MRKILEYAGIAASVVLIAFGVASIVTGFNGRERVSDDLAREHIVGTPDSEIPGQLVDSGKEAEDFAAVIRKHTLEATDGRTYAQMGRFIDKNGKETDDEKLAAKDPKTGQPQENEARNIWVTSTGLHDRDEHGVLRRKGVDVRHRHGICSAPDRDRSAGPHAPGPPWPAGCGDVEGGLMSAAH